jgi:hypothetical protein
MAHAASSTKYLLTVQILLANYSLGFPWKPLPSLLHIKGYKSHIPAFFAHTNEPNNSPTSPMLPRSVTPYINTRTSKAECEIKLN